MGLNIKNESTHRLVRELSKLTGESQTEAITTAVRERLERLRSKPSHGGLAQKLLAIGRDCAPRLKEPYRGITVDELLYGPDGLPR